MGIKSGFQTGQISSARFIKSDSMPWPSYILGGGKMVRSTLTDIFSQMNEGILPYFWLRSLEEDPEFEDIAAEFNIRKINFWRGMYLRKENPFKILPPIPGIFFEEVKTPENLKSWLDLVNLEIMSNRELGIRTFQNVLHDPTYRFFTVTRGKKTISTILMHKRNTETGIYMVSTMMSERGKGIGRWITASAIDLFISEGCRDFVLHATPLGFPVYAKLGFEECCEYGIFWLLGKK